MYVQSVLITKYLTKIGTYNACSTVNIISIKCLIEKKTDTNLSLIINLTLFCQNLPNICCLCVNYNIYGIFFSLYPHFVNVLIFVIVVKKNKPPINEKANI